MNMDNPQVARTGEAPGLMRVAEVAKAKGVSRAAIYKAMSDGRLSFVLNENGKKRITTSVAERYTPIPDVRQRALRKDADRPITPRRATGPRKRFDPIATA